MIISDSISKGKMKMVLVVNFFDLFCFVVAIFDLVHYVPAIHDLC